MCGNDHVLSILCRRLSLWDCSDSIYMVLKYTWKLNKINMISEIKANFLKRIRLSQQVFSKVKNDKSQLFITLFIVLVKISPDSYNPNNSFNIQLT